MKKYITDERTGLKYELKFADGSYGYRPNRSITYAIIKVKSALYYTITNERLACKGYYDISKICKSLHNLRWNHRVRNRTHIDM